MKVYLESVNPVFRRRRLAKVLNRSRFYHKQVNHWAKVGEKLDKQSDSLVRDHQRKYGRYPNVKPEHQKLMNAEHSKLNARRTSADEAHWHNHYKARKAYNLGKGRPETHDGSSNKHRLRPSNPLRKNRDDSQGRHQISVKDMLKARSADKKVKAEWKTQKTAKKESFESRIQKLLDHKKKGK